MFYSCAFAVRSRPPDFFVSDKVAMMRWMDVSNAPRVLDELERIKNSREQIFDQEKEDRADLEKLREAFEGEFLEAVGCRGEFVDKIDALRTDMRKKHAEEETRFHETYGAILDGRDRFFDAYVDRVRSAEAQLKDLRENGGRTLEDVRARLNLPEDTLLLLEKNFHNDVRGKEKALEDGRNVVRNLLVRHLEGKGGDATAILDIARRARIQGDDGQPLACDAEASKREVSPMMTTDLAYFRLHPTHLGDDTTNVSKYCPV